MLNSAFVQMVVSERGDKLRISGDEISEGTHLFRDGRSEAGTS